MLNYVTGVNGEESTYLSQCDSIVRDRFIDKASQEIVPALPVRAVLASSECAYVTLTNKFRFRGA